MTTKTRRPARARRTPEERREQAEALHEKLTAQVATLAESENWKAWLRFAGTIRRRSFSNQMLILAQGGTYCLGYRQWEGLGRHVVKGAKSIKIFGYSTKRIVEVDDTTGEETTSSRVIYPVLSVFDVADTEGDPLPEQPAIYLEGDDANGLFAPLAEFITAQGWDVALEDIAEDGLNGYTQGSTRRIRVDSKMAPAMQVKTLLHEIAHALLHFDEDSTREHRGLIETEAESTAYAAGALLGIDTSAWSIGYVAGWAGGDVDLIRSTAANVLRAVNAIADAILGTEDDAAA
ncbi:ArdC-like ssDNA-binding domain-containing protein [Microbacterium lacticum]|uniref:ArdC-like ssDNA-binding domain-containing protein n=1 Tax=Microbacterium lacticum TaxID=33885 RepID=UPI001F560375|nr:ArdC-like ssDNA-binding domain-containing protein [Microbacterium lacticum]